jgi:hypothetical protein
MPAFLKPLVHAVLACTHVLCSCCASGQHLITDLLHRYPAGTPSGLCNTDAECTSAQQCSRATVTAVCRCQNGRDTCQRMGSCVAKPPEVTPCQGCSQCLSNVNSALPALLGASVTAGNAQGAADNAMLWCSSQSAYSSGQCQSLKEAISKSLNGALGLRAGAVCTRLGQCNRCDGAVTLGSVSSPLDMCTLEGVTTGTQLAGTYVGTGMVLLCIAHACSLCYYPRANT